MGEIKYKLGKQEEGIFFLDKFAKDINMKSYFEIMDFYHENGREDLVKKYIDNMRLTIPKYPMLY